MECPGTWLQRAPITGFIKKSETKGLGTISNSTFTGQPLGISILVPQGRQQAYLQRHYLWEQVMRKYALEHQNQNGGNGIRSPRTVMIPPTSEISGKE